VGTGDIIRLGNAQHLAQQHLACSADQPLTFGNDSVEKVRVSTRSNFLSILDTVLKMWTRGDCVEKVASLNLLKIDQNTTGIFDRRYLAPQID
jgi:hypothetical protein